MKRKQHGRSFLSVWNKRVLCATARHASHVRKRPSEQFAVSVFFFCFVLFCFFFFFCLLTLQTIELKEETNGFYSRARFLISSKQALLFKWSAVEI